MASVASAEQGKQGKKKAGNAPNRDEPSSSELPAILDTARGDEVANAGSAAEAAAVAEGVSAAVPNSANLDATAATPANESQASPGDKRKRAAGDDIDAIFNQAKQDKNQGAAGSGQKGNKGKADAKTQAKGKSPAKKGKKQEKGGGAGGAADAESKPRKRTQEGYRVYGEEELGWNKKTAGGTALCPFDCDCCF
ncbi:hypothetical protein CLOM_g2148 [Closterium sp. NIES-68]|nr:hypothetical protein CLOM_g2148 [Closterium sp. NIES-68]GJP59371.1 hypothetical protein CLOP_g11484 [Closterium sp. NIES-67]GJP68759.1 hypothetical protein CLOP_g25423 [Closterium sp. NIES-67]